MAMKKIKPTFGKVVPPAVNTEKETPEAKTPKVTIQQEPAKPKKKPASVKHAQTKPDDSANSEASISSITSVPNPFLQSKEIFNNTNLTKIGYRMRSEYVELLDIQKKLKKGGYTLEAVLDDALTYYFENSEDGKEARKKAELFYS